MSNRSSPRSSRNNSDAGKIAPIPFPMLSSGTPGAGSAEEIARGRRLSNSSAANARQRLATGSVSSAHGPPDYKFASSPSTAEIIDLFEKEQEAMVNKLQREITSLRSDRSRSRSQSSSSSRSIQLPRSISYSDNEERPRASADEMVALRRENEVLRKRIADLSHKLTEREHELDQLKRRSSFKKQSASAQK